MVGITGVLALGWEASSRATKPTRATFAWTLDDYPELSAEEVVVRARDGVTLAGRFFRGRTRATIVLSHGYAGGQDELLPIARTLAGAGFGVMTYDLRGCGASGGRITFGAHEQRDLAAVLDYVTSRDDVDPRTIGALGFSMGAATTIMAAADDQRIKALVDDSGWSDVRHWLRPSFRTWLRSPRHQFSPLSLKLIELRTGMRFSGLRPVDVIARLSPRALLVVHGSADEVVPPGDSEENYAAAGEPKDLWVVPGAAHGETVAPGGATSTDRIADFFARVLLS